MTMPDSSGPVETKVKAASIAATITAAILWVLDTYVFDDLTGVPDPIVGIIQLAVIAGVTWAAGYMAKHTPRTYPQVQPGAHEAR